MQHAESLEHLQDEMEDMIGLDFCNHDHHWLDYCALGGHEHYELANGGNPEQRLARAA